MEEKLLVSLVKLLQDKKICLDDMLVLSERETDAIVNREEIELTSILDKKDYLIDKIDVIDLDFKNTVNKQLLEDEKLSSVLSEINVLLNEIKSIDDENNKKLQVAIDEMKLNLKDVRKGKRAMSNYSNSDPYQSFASQGGTLFIDQDS